MLTLFLRFVAQYGSFYVTLVAIDYSTGLSHASNNNLNTPNTLYLRFV